VIIVYKAFENEESEYKIGSNIKEVIKRASFCDPILYPGVVIYSDSAR
jgi:hypothetical protein